ncbi:hypothetical protein J1605_017852 [Eschrichtius robustus]|uniref:Uncharacterized protein n=1 Tax=Eschrichtius robustus TaxID=9764 RepID=A0AB34HZ68_ESCRO|nr:hypothetical protein J1605_017852 [Eschrichtius robustus]
MGKVVVKEQELSNPEGTAVAKSGGVRTTDGNAISKYWIYKWVHVSSLQTCSISSDFTQTVPSKEQASPVRG